MNLRFLTSLSAAALLLDACGGGGTSGTLPSGAGTATLSAKLVDGPFRTSSGTATAVWVTISKVEAVGDGGVQTIATFSPSQKVNLTDLQDPSKALSLGSATIPAGHYQQIRLVLDTSQPGNTSVDVLDSTTNTTTNYPLTIPSATGPSGFGGGTSTDGGDGPGTSGIKVNVGLDAQAGQSYALLIDFNAAESIVSAGASGQWLMKPVLVGTMQATAGSISGTVVNKAGTPVGNAEVEAVQGTTVVNTGVTDPNTGAFEINALAAGTYTLIVKNSWNNQAGAAQTATGADGTADVTDPNSVTVTAGQTTSGVSITD